MGYRTLDIPPVKPDEMLPVFEVYNGAPMKWSFPCFYFEVEQPIDWHDYHMHDHLGWPDPHHPGHACQALPDYYGLSFSPASVWNYLDMHKAKKIHLLSDYEGYSSTGSVVFDTVDGKGDSVTLTGLSATLAIRPAPEDWIVDITFNPAIAAFADKPKEFLFNSYIKSGSRIDLFLRGRLAVLPGPASSGLSS